MLRAMGLAGSERISEPVHEPVRFDLFPILSDIQIRLIRIEDKLSALESPTLAPKESMDYISEWNHSELRTKIEKPQNPLVKLVQGDDTDPKFEVYRNTRVLSFGGNPLVRPKIEHYIRHKATKKTYKETSGFTE